MIKHFQIGDCDSRTRSSTPDVLRPSAGSMSSGSVIGVTSASGVSITLPPGRSSLVSEEETPETCSLANSIGPCVNDQSPMVRFFEFFNIVRDSKMSVKLSNVNIFFPKY